MPHYGREMSEDCAGVGKKSSFDELMPQILHTNSQ